MKYWKNINTNRSPEVLYKQSETQPYTEDIDTINYMIANHMDITGKEFFEVSKNEFNLFNLYSIITPETINPETGKAWTNDQEKQAWISHQLQEQNILKQHDKGTMADDIVLLHTSLLELVNHYVMWLPYSALAEKQRLKIQVETMIKYNLELVNKDFNPDFVLTSRDRGVLISVLTLVKNTYPDHWALIAPIFKLEAEATPDEVWTEYEKIMETLHTAHSTPDLTGAGIGQGIR